MDASVNTTTDGSVEIVTMERKRNPPDDAMHESKHLRTSFDASSAFEADQTSRWQLAPLPNILENSANLSPFPIIHSHTNKYNCQLPTGENVTLRKVPDFIIIGAQKSGTSALADLLGRHLLFARSLRQEPHFFDDRVQINDLDDDARLCQIRKEYSNQWPSLMDQFFPVQNVNFRERKRWTFEKTPSYLTIQTIAEKVDRVCFWRPKIIVSLRNPIDRAFSQYRMNNGNPIKGTFSLFEDRLRDSTEQWRAWNISSLPPFNSSLWLDLPNEAFQWPVILNDSSMTEEMSKDILMRGFYSEQLRIWMSRFKLYEDLLVLQYETFRDNPRKVLNKVLKFLGAPPMNLNPRLFQEDYRYSPKREPKGDFGHQPEKGKGRANQTELSDDVRAALQRLYRPYNQELARLLGNSWLHVWD